MLDVACGTGNAALPAARAGARVTGLDLVPKLLEHGRQKAAAAGVEIAWVEGDAEELPFEDDAFDRVFSTVGHMFAPRHQRVAEEMARVCRPGGVIATCTWTPEGTVGDVFAASAAYMPPPPEFASPPILRAPLGDDRVGVPRGVGGLLLRPLRPSRYGEADARRASCGTRQQDRRDLRRTHRGD